jgi:hypothetical protein
MFPKFLEGLGSAVAQRWAAVILAPAFIFWLGGLTAWLWHVPSGPFGWSWAPGWKPLVLQFNRLSTLPTATQLALAVGAFLLIALSSLVLERFVVPALRLLEGYWPRRLDGLRDWVAHRRVGRLTRDTERREELAKMRNRCAKQQREYARLDAALRRMPTAGDLMPTRLGNILRAAEGQPVSKYGLDAIILWSRLWLVLPDATRTELDKGRAALDAAVRVWLWCILFVVWTVWAWWAAPLALVAALFTYYSWILDAASTYADLLEATFDVHRGALYQALRWPPPASPQDELRTGAQVTQYLWAGSDAPTPQFTGGTAPAAPNPVANPRTLPRWLCLTLVLAIGLWLGKALSQARRCLRER